MKVCWQGRMCALFLIVGAAAVATPAQTFTTLVNFDGTNGANPDPKALVQGTDGNLYGTAQAGGANSSGTVFKMTPAGALTTLYNFCSLPSCADGNSPVPGLVLGTDGNFYGMSAGGGAYGVGTAFKITPEGVLTTLHSFDTTDGSYPFSRLTEGTDGSFYGTTSFGRNVDWGTVFKITPDGTLTTLYNFCSETNCTDGATAYDGLAEGQDGNFYGTTWQGGANNVGTVFKITPEGALSKLYSFCTQNSCPGGYNPVWLTLGANGNFYGTTYAGAANGGGAVFEVTPGGTVTTLYNFCAQNGCSDGSSPRAGLLLGSDNNFYGTTYYGGANLQNDGTVFKITPAGTLTTLHSFDGGDGANPIGGLGQAADGTVYGTTTYGGNLAVCSGSGCGTVFSLAVGLTQPLSPTAPQSI